MLAPLLDNVRMPSGLFHDEVDSCCLEGYALITSGLSNGLSSILPREEFNARKIKQSLGVRLSIARKLTKGG
ncbi:hypothetical protein EMIT0232MI5_30160 [Pseudomonas sp. IT-232MI5]